MSIPHDRFRCHAFVCGKSCSKPSPVEGWALFGDIFSHRPNDCRFAVVENVLGEFLAWDLLDDDLALGQFRKVPPAPMWDGPTADAVIMKAMALYDRA
jgi:hypothetical protein